MALSTPLLSFTTTGARGGSGEGGAGGVGAGGFAGGCVTGGGFVGSGAVIVFPSIWKVAEFSGRECREPRDFRSPWKEIPGMATGASPTIVPGFVPTLSDSRTPQFDNRT